MPESLGVLTPWDLMFPGHAGKNREKRPGCLGTGPTGRSLSPCHIQGHQNKSQDKAEREPPGSGAKPQGSLNPGCLPSPPASLQIQLVQVLTWPPWALVESSNQPFQGLLAPASSCTKGLSISGSSAVPSVYSSSNFWGQAKPQSQQGTELAHSNKDIILGEETTLPGVQKHA